MGILKIAHGVKNIFEGAIERDTKKLGKGVVKILVGIVTIGSDDSNEDTDDEDN